MLPMTPEFTGQVRFRTGWFGRLILQVEVVIQQFHPTEKDLIPIEVWRDAKASDITRQKLPGARADKP